MIFLDGAQGEGGGQIIRTALALSAATGQAFHITRIRAGRVRPGLQPQHLAAVRAAAMVCGASVGGAFDGSPDVRFEPGPVRPGEFRFEIATAGALTLLLQTVIGPLATASEPSRVEVTGGTHVPRSPSFHYLARHWAAVVEWLGLQTRLDLVRAGFYPPGGGEARAEVQPWRRPARLVLENRGKLLAIRGIAGAARLPGVAERMRRAAEERLWESRRLESAWEVVEVPAPSKGCFLLLEAVFEQGRGAFGLLGERRVRAEALGDRAARQVLKFLDADDGAVDPHLADQLVLPLALAGGGGRVTTPEVTSHLETVADVVSRFGIPARTWGRRGGAGGVEVGGAVDRSRTAG
ncbi:MAG TPA: RNA 3'-terminal phosphate cyclase [Vicinamibacteria bacterium]